MKILVNKLESLITQKNDIFNPINHIDEIMSTIEKIGS